MKFGPVPTGEAVGAIAAHGLRIGSVSLKKGRVITAELAAELGRAGLAEIVVARLDPDDVGEDEAAHALALRAAGSLVRVEDAFTGRSNLFAAEPGVLLIDAGRVNDANAADEALTLATLPAFKPVVAGEMVATAKVIPYGVARASLDAALAALPGPALDVAPYRLKRVAAVSTLTPGLKPSVVRKTMDTLAGRLAPAGAAISSEATCPHEAGALASALSEAADGGAELIVIFGASAIADRRDVVPAAIERAGGAVEHLGMPVDPGNLLLIGRIGTAPLLGAPGCARSPKENGFDWVLSRLLAGLAVTRADIAGMGVGGLLMEIVSRGQPRAGGDPDG